MSCITILFKTVWCRRVEEGRGREREREGREGEVGGFWLFNDTWSQYGHSVSKCDHIVLNSMVQRGTMGTL